MFALRSGARLGQYEIQRVVGSGGMGVVYEAHHEALGRRVALKVMHTTAPDAPSDLAMARFLREGRAAAQVRHDNVVDVFDFGVHEGTPFLVMELVEGESLCERLEREHTLPIATALELLLPIFSAVSALHAAGIIHRDLKPANILLGRGRGGEVSPKVADFGVSRIDDAPCLTESGVVVGSYPYMPPEQVRALKEATEPADQYSLGAILYECLTGKRPYEGTSAYELAHAILHAPLIPPSVRNPAVPVALDAVLNRALAREAEARFPTVDDFGAALIPFAARGVAARWSSEFAPPSSSGSPVPTIAPVSRSQIEAQARGQGRARRLWGRATIGVVATVSAGIAVALLRAAPASRSEALASVPPQSSPLKHEETAVAEPVATVQLNGATASDREAAAVQPVVLTEPMPADSAIGARPPPGVPSPRSFATPSVRPRASGAGARGVRGAASSQPRDEGDNHAPLLDPR